MNQATSAATLLPATIGESWEGGFYGGQIRVGASVFAVVWAPKSEGETKAAWLDRYENVSGTRSTSDSRANTQAMAEAGSPAGKWALGLAINGFTDWCLPARDVLDLGYRHLKPTTDENACTFRDGDNPCSVPPGELYTEDSPAQTTVAAFQSGGAEAFDATWYFSSTQYSDSLAYCQDFGDGSQDVNYKLTGGRCRAVRMVHIA